MGKNVEKQDVEEAIAEKRQAIFDHLKQEPLAGHTTEERLRRMSKVVSQRLGSVTVVMENLHDAHNVGAVVRTAECYGVDTLHVVEMPNPYNPHKGISQGADKWLEVKRHQGLNRVMGDLMAAGYTICAADVGEGCIPLAELPVDKPLAILMGSERDGVSDRAKKLVDVRFSIPMVGFTESFNVSVSAAVVLHEITQRRRQYLGTQGDLSLEDCKKRVSSWLPRAIRRSVQKLINKGIDVTDESISSGTNNGVPLADQLKGKLP
jgi:tRNA (guanosine-2'-O-)-methyltransferase